MAATAAAPRQGRPCDDVIDGLLDLYPGRAVLLLRLPDTVAALTANRLSTSGLNAWIAGGVASIPRAPLVMEKTETALSRQAKMTRKQ